MLLRLTPRRDEAAAMAFEDVASGLDAGLPPDQLGGDPSAGERVLHGLFARRRIDLDPVEAEVLAAAWRAGRAPVSLRHLAEQRQQRAGFARAVLKSLAYPVVLVAMAGLAAFIASRIAGSGTMLVVLAVASVAVVLVALMLHGAAHGREPWISLPGVAPWAADLAELPYLEVLRGLYGAGVPLLQAHPQAVAACPVADSRRRLEAADRELQKGRPLGEALASATALHAETRHLITTGERTGGLEQALARALQRRREVGARRTAVLARVLGLACYAVGAGVAIYVIVSFYGGYFGALRLR
jgi:type II secretory pathway component PulF